MDTFDRRELFEKVTDLFAWVDKDKQQGDLKSRAPIEYIDEDNSYTYEPAAQRVIVRPKMSRRSFLAVAGALGVSVAITGADGETWGIVQAFADENDYGFTIIVLTKEDAGFLTVDPSNNTRIDGMQVSITSRANKKTVQATTNASGQGFANIRELAKNTSKDALSYSFWGSIRAHKNGYRAFESGLVRVNGGPPPKGTQPLTIPSQKDTGEPYAVSLTYDGYDMQYFTTTILLSKKNDEQHAIEVALAHVNETVVSLWHNGSKIGECKTAKIGGYANAWFYGKFNQTFLKGKKTYIRFNVGSKTYEIEAKLVCFSDDEMDGVSLGNKPLPPGGFSDIASSPGGDELPELSIKVPANFPVFGGTTINLDLPSLPVYAYLTPFGTAVITTNINDMEFLEDDEGNLIADKKWKMTTKEGWTDYRNRLKADWEKAKERHGAAKALAADPKAKTTTSPFSEKSKLKAVFSVSAMLDWQYYDSERAKRWTGSYNASIGLSYTYSYTRQMTIGPVPVYVGFDIGLTGMAATSSAVSIKGFFEDIKWVPGARQWSFTAGFEFGVSAGVGISGFVSFGVRGMAAISITFAYVLNPPAGNDTRHLFSYLNAGVSYVLQVLCFKASGTIYKLDPIKIYDNWNSSLPEAIGQGPDQTIAWEIMTQEDLGLYLEAEGEIPDEDGLDPKDIDALGRTGTTSESLEALDDEILLVPQDAEASGSPEGGVAFGLPNNQTDTSGEHELDTLNDTGELGGEDTTQGNGQNGGEDTTQTEGQGADQKTENQGAGQDTENEQQVSLMAAGVEDPKKLPLVSEGVEEPFAPVVYTVTSPQTTGESCAQLGVLDPFDVASGYDITEGVRPSTEVIIYKDAYTDPRTKTVALGKDLYMIRFVTVKVTWLLWTYNITRLAISKYENGQSWSKPQIIDFEFRKDNPTGKRRTYVYDYEFDVVAAEDTKLLHIMLTSGTRPDGSDATKWYEAANQMMASYVCYDPAANKVTTALTDFTVYDQDYPDGEYMHAVFPRIETVGTSVLAAYCAKKGGQKVENGYLGCLRALIRSTGGGAFSSSKGEHPSYFDTMVGRYSGAPDIQDFALSRAPYSYKDTGDPAYMFSLEFITAIPQRSLDYFVATVFPGTTYSGTCLKDELVKRGQFFGPLATHAHSGFIIPTATNEATGQQQLSHITINPDFSANAYVIGWVNRGSAFITSADGKYLFTTSIMEGKMPKATSEEEVFGETPDASSTDIFDNVDAERKLYQLYATRYYESTKSFSSFFPFAQLSNPIDSLDHLKFAGNDKSSESLAFIFNSIVDPTAKQLHANLYFASVPFVCSLQLEGVTCQEDFVGVGDTCHLVFNVINTGNLGISSFKAKLCYDKEGKNVFTELTLEQLADKVVLSEEHLDVETGEQELTAADKTGVFLPGEKRLFKTTFTVPEAWKDKKEIELFVFVYAPAVAKISDGYTDFGEDLSDTTYIDMQTTDALASAVSLDIDTDRQGTLEGLSGGLYRSWNAGSGDSGNMPRTNDGSLPLLLAAASAAAASGLVFGMKAIRSKTDDAQ